MVANKVIFAALLCLVTAYNWKLETNGVRPQVTTGDWSDGVFFDSATLTTCQSNTGCTSSNPTSYTSSSLNFSVSGGGVIINVAAPNSAGSTCQNPYGCPTQQFSSSIAGFNAVSRILSSTGSANGKAKSVLMLPGGKLTFRIPSSLAFGFNVSSNFDTVLTASAFNIVNGSLVAIGNGVQTVGPSTGHPVKANGFLTPVIFSAPAPFTTYFTVIEISSSAAGWLTFNDVFWGETGYYCLDYENTNKCLLTVNLIDLPFNNIEMQVGSVSQSGSIRDFGYCSVADYNNSLCSLPFQANKLVHICVLPDQVPTVVIKEDNAIYTSNGAVNNGNYGVPACGVAATGHSDHCYLDPRASIVIPSKCWPTLEYATVQQGGAVDPNAYTAIVLWNGIPPASNPVTASNVLAFRVVNPLTNSVSFPNGWPANGFPTLTVLAVPNVYASASVISGGYTNSQFLNGFSNNYDCSKNANSSAPRVSSLVKGNCIPKDAWGTTNAPFSNTEYIAIRAKCSSDAYPPMNTNVTLTIQSPLVFGSSQNSLTYTLLERGNVDTAICVVSAGAYTIIPSENGVAAGSQKTNCSFDNSYTCNGTPNDVVNHLNVGGCCQGSTCGVPHGVYPSVGGDANGLYDVTLFSVTAGGVAQQFRTVQVDPNQGLNTCVLNYLTTRVEMPVIASTNDAQALIKVDFACSTGATSAGTVYSTSSNWTINSFTWSGQTAGYCIPKFDHSLPAGEETNVPTKFPLFALLDVDLFELSGIDYGISLVTPTATGVLPAFPVIGGTQGDGFCNRPVPSSLFGEKVCVPAIGSRPVSVGCGDCADNQNVRAEMSYGIQVTAEECGSAPGVITCSADAGKKRGDGDCITSVVVVDCSGYSDNTKRGFLDGPQGDAYMSCAVCSARLSQQLCLWDTLYLPTYTQPQQGVVVELYSGNSNSTNVIRTAGVNQGGAPHTYRTLPGQLRVRVIDNPPAVIAPIDAVGAAITAPHTVSRTLDCSVQNQCSFNEFVSVLDVSGDATVGIQTAGPEEGTVFCSAITYQDSYSYWGFEDPDEAHEVYKSRRQVVKDATVSMAVNGRTFRPTTAVVNRAYQRSKHGNTCIPQKYYVLRTQNYSYTASYKWAQLTRTVSDLTCASSSCAPVECIVRWLPIDPACPETYADFDQYELGFNTPSKKSARAYENDAENQCSHYTRLENTQAVPVCSNKDDIPQTFQTLSVNGVSLQSEFISHDYYYYSMRTKACRLNYALANTTLISAFSDDYSQLFPDFERYFVLSSDDATTPVDVTVGCQTVRYNANCPVNVVDTGLKNIYDPTHGMINTPGPYCGEFSNNYWHSCSWVGAASNLLGTPQYWAAAVSSDGTCTLYNKTGSAMGNYKPWVPLAPFVTIDVNLIGITNGSSDLNYYDDDCDFTTLDEGVRKPECGDQNNYRGDPYSNNVEYYYNTTAGDQTFFRYNPFDINVCCGNKCGAARSIREEANECKGDRCTPEPVPTCTRIQNAGNCHNYVCMLASGEYSIQVQELYRQEDLAEFTDQNPGICPVDKHLCLQRTFIENCRPSYCYAPPQSVGNIEYPFQVWFKNETITPVTNIRDPYTASFQYRCPANDADHTLLRPNFLMSEGNIGWFLKASGQYSAVSNTRNRNVETDLFSCGSASATTCVAPTNAFHPRQKRDGISLPQKKSHTQKHFTKKHATL